MADALDHDSLARWSRRQFEESQAVTPTDEKLKTWETRVVFTASTAFQVLASSEDKALQIAIEQVRNRKWTDSVKVLISKAWECPMTVRRASMKEPE